MTPKACALVLVTCLLLASGPTGSTGPTGSEAAEATQGASGVSGASGSGGTGTCSYDAHHEKLWCSLRTLNAQNNTASIQSSTRARHMNVQCSDVFFYESILRTNHFNYLPNLQSLTLEFCKIRRIPSLAFSGLSGLHELVIRTHNSEWSAMVMELESDAFTGKVSNIYLHCCIKCPQILREKTVYFSDKVFFPRYALGMPSFNNSVHKDRIFPKNLLENKEMDFKNGVKNIQTAGYNGARTHTGSFAHNSFQIDLIN